LSGVVLEGGSFPGGENETWIILEAKFKPKSKLNKRSRVVVLRILIKKVLPRKGLLL